MGRLSEVVFIPMKPKTRGYGIVNLKHYALILIGVIGTSCGLHQIVLRLLLFRQSLYTATEKCLSKMFIKTISKKVMCIKKSYSTVMTQN